MFTDVKLRNKRQRSQRNQSKTRRHQENLHKRNQQNPPSERLEPLRKGTKDPNQSNPQQIILTQRRMNPKPHRSEYRILFIGKINSFYLTV
jgi:hypothetical protein